MNKRQARKKAAGIIWSLINADYECGYIDDLLEAYYKNEKDRKRVKDGIFWWLQKLLGYERK